MSDLSSIVGQDVNLEQPQEQETPEIQAEQQEQQEQPQEQPQEQEQPQRERVVPLEALHEERARRREMQQRIAQMEQAQAERDRIIEQRLQAIAQAKMAPEPSFEENPADALRRQLEQIQQGQTQTAQQFQQWQQAQQQQAVQQRLAQTIVTQEQGFAQQRPDYIEAVQFLRNQRAAELQVDGLDEFDAQAQAHQELQNLAFQRAMQGKNPAEVAYNLAKARGFSGKQSQTVTPQDKLQSQQRGVAAARSLGSGGAPKNALTAEAIASMSDDEFAKITPEQWRKAMGG